jgi:hypothetical protein
MPDDAKSKKTNSVIAIFRNSENIASLSLPIFYKIITAVSLLIIAAWYAGANGAKDLSGTPLGADFINVYAAGLLVGQGRPEEAYNWITHSHVEQAVAGYASPYFAWHYPPMFLAVAALVAAAPYLWAFALYMAAGFVGYWVVIRRIAPQTKNALWMMASFPGVFVNLSNGQNGFITAALLGAGLMQLEKHPWLAGALLGLLAYKPQFFVVIPLILAVGGYGRAFLAAIVSAVLSVALSWAVFGTATWRAFFESTKLTQHIILEQGSTGWQKIQSVFSLVRMWGGGVVTAYVFQSVIAVGALACAAWVWRSRASLATRASALCAAILLTTPYLMDYDLVVLAIPLAFLTRQGAEAGYLRFEKPLLAALWLLPLLARIWGEHSLPTTPFVLIGLMGVCLSRP